MKKYVLLALPLVGLTGCVEHQWVKSGADKQQEEMAETRCKAQALIDLPPDNITTSKYISKDKKHKASDTSYSTSDANDSKRKILVKDCMYRNGWTLIEIQH